MKQILSLLAILFAFQCSYAQWSTSGTNTTTTNNIGIGTSTPSNKLSIVTSNHVAFDVSGNDNTFQGADVALIRANSSTTVGRSPAIQFTDNATGYASLLQSYQGQFQFFNYAGSNWLESMRITGDGKVGIGTTTPTVPLEVNGDGKYVGSLQIGNSAVNSNTTKLFINNYLGGKNWALSVGANQISEQGFYIYNWTDSPTMPLFTLSNEGNAGFGTTSPSAKLDVESSTNSSWATQIINNGTTNAHGLYVNIGSASTGIPFRVDVNGSDMFQVSNNGNIAIGTTDPQGHKLAVNGDIIATKITVKPHGNWPDYVFKPQYNLPSLSEVKTYIDKNQHLPDMPSEKEVAKDGIDLGEIVKIQAKKIEELTLYMIKLQEQNDAIMKELKSSKPIIK